MGESMRSAVGPSHPSSQLKPMILQLTPGPMSHRCPPGAPTSLQRPRQTGSSMPSAGVNGMSLPGRVPIQLASTFTRRRPIDGGRCPEPRSPITQLPLLQGEATESLSSQAWIPLSSNRVRHFAQSANRADISTSEQLVSLATSPADSENSSRTADLGCGVRVPAQNRAKEKGRQFSGTSGPKFLGETVQQLRA